MPSERDLFSIGEFSRVSGITVKALRFYQEQDLLNPTFVDPQSGYRYYDPKLLERARMILFLRQLEVPLDQIAEILRDATDETQLVEALKSHRESIRQRLRALRSAAGSLDKFIHQIEGAKSMSQNTFRVEEKTIDAMLVAGIRMKGRYSDCGKLFGKIYRSFGRLVAGHAMMLHFDSDYKEEDADFEAAMPISKPKHADGINVHQLDGVRCITLVHKGPYDEMGQSYAKVFAHLKQRRLSILLPTREIYLKGPGMIFKGNPANYLTEIQIPVVD